MPTKPTARKDEAVKQQTVPEPNGVMNYAVDMMGRIMAGECKNFLIITIDGKRGIDFCTPSAWEALGLTEYFEKAIRANGPTAAKKS